MRTKKKVSSFIDNFLVKGALKRSNHTGRLVKVVKRPTEVGDDGETDLYASVQEGRHRAGDAEGFCSVDKNVQAVHTSRNIVQRWMQELEQETSSECLKAKERAS